MSKRKTNKRRRLPNGFGQISEIKGQHLRKPFRAMITVGKNEYGKPICKLLKPEAYFETYNDAYTALLEYHKSPIEKSSNITMADLYGRWSKWHFARVNEKSAKNTTAAWAYMSSIYNVKVRELRTKHIRECIENASRIVKGEKREASADTKKRIKILFNAMLDYAVEYELADRNYAREMKMPVVSKPIKEQHHIPFTDEEVDVLWQNIKYSSFVKVILIQCYSGWRPIEMCNLRTTDTNIKEWYFIGGSKTDAGTNRKVPIHPVIRSFVKEFYNLATDIGSEYLFNIKRDKQTTYENITSYFAYRWFFTKTLRDLKLNPNHKPHDCRKHFITIAKKYNVDEYAIKYIVGHAITDLTERVYTQRDINWLQDEMKKIKGPVGIM